MNRLILLVESRIRGDVYVRFGGEHPKTHRSNTAGRWMLSLRCEVSPEDEIQFKQLAADYAATISQMPENQRIVFLMSRENEMKYRDIAKCLHISVKAVEKRMTSALKFLKINLLQNGYKKNQNHSSME